MNASLAIGATLTEGTDAIVVLRDGRVLSYAEHGDPAGIPVLFFHGVMASRLAVHPDRHVLHALGIRLVALDRPGYGLSAPHPGRTLRDWADDVAELVDHLGLRRFHVLGWSGGGPHAMACAMAMPGRAIRASLVSSMGQPGVAASIRDGLGPNRRLWNLALRAPDGIVARAGDLVIRHSQRFPHRFYRSTMARLSEPDQAVAARPEIKRWVIDYRAEGLRQGTAGIREDARLLLDPWPFDPKTMDCQVDLWHGALDYVVPLPLVQHLAEALPFCTPHLLPTEGHFLLIDRWQEILATLVH